MQIEDDDLLQPGSGENEEEVETEPIEDEDETGPKDLSFSSRKQKKPKKKIDKKNDKILPLLIVALVLAVLLLVACILRVCCCKGKKRDDEKKGKTSTGRQSRSVRELTDEEKAIRSFVARIVIVGDSGTGKSALLNSYKETYPSSVPLEPLAKGARMATDHGNKILNQSGKLGYAEGSMKLSQKDAVNVLIVDTPGAPEQRNVFMPALAGKNGAVVMYDITSLESYLNARNWIKLLKSKSGSNVVISLVGNKLDSAQSGDSREVERA